MSPETQNILSEALRLPRKARAMLVEKLLESLGAEEPVEISREWREEIERRCREIDFGRVNLIPGDDVLKEAAERLGE